MPATEGTNAQPDEEQQQLLGEVRSMSLTQNRNENAAQNSTAANDGAHSEEEEVVLGEPACRPNIRALIEEETDSEDESRRPVRNVIIDEETDDEYHAEQQLAQETSGSTGPSALSDGAVQDHDYTIGDVEPRQNVKELLSFPAMPPLDEYYKAVDSQEQAIPGDARYMGNRRIDASRQGTSPYRSSPSQPPRIVGRQAGIGSLHSSYLHRDHIVSNNQDRRPVAQANSTSLMPRRPVETHQRRSHEELTRSLPPTGIRRSMAVEGTVAAPTGGSLGAEPGRPANSNQHAPFIVPASGPKFMNRSRAVRQRGEQAGAATGTYSPYEHGAGRKSESPAKVYESPVRILTSPYQPPPAAGAQPTPESALIDVVEEEEMQNEKFFQQQRQTMLKGLGGTKTQPVQQDSETGGQQPQKTEHVSASSADQIAAATSGTTTTPMTQEHPVDSAITSPPGHLRPYDTRTRTVSETAAVNAQQQVPQYGTEVARSPQRHDAYVRPTIVRTRPSVSASVYPSSTARIDVPVSGAAQRVTAYHADDASRFVQQGFVTPVEYRRNLTGLSPQRGMPRYEYASTEAAAVTSPQLQQQQFADGQQAPLYSQQQEPVVDDYAYRGSRSGLAELAHASQITQRHISSPPRMGYVSPERGRNYTQEPNIAGVLNQEQGLPSQHHPPDARASRHALQTSAASSSKLPAETAETEQPRRRGRRRAQETAATGEATAEKKEEEGDDQDYTTRCLCGLVHNDPLMIQCDACNVWQHMLCMNVDSKRVPEKYYCEACAPRTLKYTQAEARALQEEYLEKLKKLSTQKRGSRGRKSDATQARRLSKEEPRHNARNRTESRVSTHSGSGLEPQVENKLSRSLRAFLNTNQLENKGDPNLLSGLVKGATKELLVAPGTKGLVTAKADPDSAKKGGFEAGEPIVEYHAHFFFVTDNPQKFNTPPRNNSLIYRGLGDDENLAIYADASKVGSEARVAPRRSCQPNSEVRHVVKDGKLHLVLVATEQIGDCEEITIPFEKEYKLSSTPIQCACGRTDTSEANPCPIQAFNDSLASGGLLPNGSQPHTPGDSETATPRRRGLITIGGSSASAKPKQAAGSSGKGRPGRPRKVDSPSTPTLTQGRVGPFKMGRSYLESTERKKTPQDEKDTKELSVPKTAVAKATPSENGKVEPESGNSSPRADLRRSSRSRGASSSVLAPPEAATVPEPEAVVKPKEEANPVMPPPPSAPTSKSGSQFSPSSEKLDRDARKALQYEQMFEKMEQKEKKRESHGHSEKTSPGDKGSKAAAAQKSSRRGASTDVKDEPSAKRGKLARSPESKRRPSVTEDHETKKSGRKGKAGESSTQVAPEKLLAETALPPAEMAASSRRLRNNSRAEAATNDSSPAELYKRGGTTTRRPDATAVKKEEGRTKEAEGAALKRQISQQEAAHVLTEMASHYSSPSRASPLQVDVSGQHSPPHYPQISPTAEAKGVGGMLNRLSIASQIVSRNEFMLPNNFASAPLVKTPEEPPPPKRVKKITLAEYKSRRPTMDSASGATSNPVTASAESSTSSKPKSIPPTKRQSFIPTIADTSIYSSQLEPVSVVPSIDVKHLNLDVLKERIYGTQGGSPSKEVADSPSVSTAATADSTTGEPVPSTSDARAVKSHQDNSAVSSTTPTTISEPMPAPVRASSSSGPRQSIEERLKSVFGLDVAKSKPQPSPQAPGSVPPRRSARKFEDTRARAAVSPPRQLPTCPPPADRQINARPSSTYQSSSRR